MADEKLRGCIKNFGYHKLNSEQGSYRSLYKYDSLLQLMKDIWTKKLDMFEGEA